MLYLGYFSHKRKVNKYTKIGLISNIQGLVKMIKDYAVFDVKYRYND